MPKVWIILVVAAAALTIFTIVDVVLTDARRMRGVPKPVWVLIAILPIVGTLLWFLVGKGPADSTYRRSTAPDDDPSFLSGLGTKAEQDERIRRLEQELADLDDDPPKE
jgi:hypothetical protein